MTINVYKKFGARVKELRKKAGLSQEELAAKANLNRSYMNEVETGKANLSLKKIRKISRALKVKTSDLIDF